jgi:restriction system protein
MLQNVTTRWEQIAMTQATKKGSGGSFVARMDFLPWWGGFVLAVLLYLWLHQEAEHYPDLPLRGQPVETWLTDSLQALWLSCANVLQYVVPSVCAGTSLHGFWQRRLRTGILRRLQGQSAPEELHALSWIEFEDLVSDVFRRQGYSVLDTRNDPQGGLALVLSRHGHRTLLLCKHWRSRSIDADVVRRLSAEMAALGVDTGMIVSSGDFTAEAARLVQGRSIWLLSGHALLHLIHEQQRAMARPWDPLTHREAAPTRPMNYDDDDADEPLTARVAAPAPPPAPYRG